MSEDSSPCYYFESIGSRLSNYPLTWARKNKWFPYVQHIINTRIELKIMQRDLMNAVSSVL